MVSHDLLDDAVNGKAEPNKQEEEDPEAASHKAARHKGLVGCAWDLLDKCKPDEGCSQGVDRLREGGTEVCDILGLQDSLHIQARQPWVIG